MLPFVHLSIVFWSYMTLQYRKSKSSNLLVFHSSGGISTRQTAFLFLVFACSSWVNLPNLMYSWLFIIFVMGFIVSLGIFQMDSWNFPFTSIFVPLDRLVLVYLSRCPSFHSLLLLSVTLSSTEFLILHIWPWMYSICSFFDVLISSLFALLSFWALALVGFLLWHRQAVLHLVFS